MKIDNERFKVILTDAKLICLSKYNLVEAKFGADHADVAAIKTEMDTTTGHFDNPALWLSPIPFDEDAITGFIVKIDQCDPSDLPLFLTELRGFIKYLQNTVLKAPIAAMETTDINDFNLKVLDELLQAQRNVGGRKAYFKNQGTDLDNHPPFVVLQDEQRPILEEYRRVLRTNEVQSTESDVLIFKRIAAAIHQSTILAKFLLVYAMLTSTMKAKLPAEPKP